MLQGHADAVPVVHFCAAAPVHIPAAVDTHIWFKFRGGHDSGSAAILSLTGTLDEACEEVAMLMTEPDKDPQTDLVLNVYKDARKKPER